MRNLVLALVAITCISCNRDEIVFDEVQTVRNSEWSWGNDHKFIFDVADTSQVYRLLLYLEYSTDYNWQNLYTNITTTYPSDSTLTDLVSFELANRSGSWYGDCNEEKCALNIPMQERVRFPLPGEYSINFEQSMRQEHLPGIEAIGVKLVIPAE